MQPLFPLTTAGLGLKPEHHAEVITSTAEGLWFEAHPENFMMAGGPQLARLTAVRERWPLSLHGVGLSLGGDAPPDPEHLAALRRLVDRFEPFLVSEHLAWSSFGGRYRPDLLPVLRTRAALDRVVENVERTQDALGRAVLIENPSLYMPVRGHQFGEAEFLSELVRRAGCGLLLDVNNAFVSAANLGFDPDDYLDSLPAEAIGEIHLAGHAAETRGGVTLLIDTHGAPVCEPVWKLYERLIGRIGPRPTLIERDDALPSFAELMRERDRADRLLAAAETVHA
jgi:uncharacterized protein (UPF0276 family)